MPKTRRPPRSGFIYIIGWRVITTRDRTPEIRSKCPACDVPDARLQGRIKRPWLTLFFIPICPLASAASAQRVSRCLECRKTFDMPVEQLARFAGAMVARDLRDTIPVYNELRDSPEDGKIMLKLLGMYEALGELAEAESAARHFPKALAADPACGALLEKMRRDGGT